jgi:peptide/nickel transport system ATP-binding protein
MMTHTLQVDNLKTWFFSNAGIVKAVDDVSFSLRSGEIMGLVGESGSGKSMTAYSILGLIDPPGKIVAGRILFKGQDVRRFSEEQLRVLRGNRIAIIFQDPMMTLNPVLRIDTQMIEAVRAHQAVSKSAARLLAREALVRVGIAAPDERLESYPHAFSGGMRQRVAIAIALLNKPDLIIADEPTTALDVTIQGQILFEMQKICREMGSSLIWITHDLSVVAGLADTICVMYAGRIVEKGTVAEVLQSPTHPYTQGLLQAAPSRNIRGLPLKQIPGLPPSLLNLPVGCAFRERCGYASDICMTEPPMTLYRGHEQRCFHPLPRK